nr:PREDICTED: zinc transporter 1 isoform X1 [Bemisia tabaci]
MSPDGPQPVLPNKPLQAEKMVMKKWFRSLQPVQLYVILTITLFFFLVQLVVSHLTHALTLLVDAYHVLCNLIALFGCIITLKYGTEDPSHEDSKSQKSDLISNKSMTALPTSCSRDGHSSSCVHPVSERRLKNTFGWARIEVLVMLIVSVFLASLCFSLIVESVQTLIHIGHHDEMHHPIQVLSVGAAGLLLNGICYLLIGGYTFHQGSYLHVTASGDIVLQKKAKKSGAEGKQPSSRRKFVSAGPIMAPPKRQGPWEVCRDIIGCVFVMICAVTVYFSDPKTAKYIDPIFSIISAVLLLILSYPYMKESCLILLQTIPDHINIDSLCTQLHKAFPDILNVHDLHVWQLTANKTFSTAHMIFDSPVVYSRIKKELMEFFHEQGVTQVTIQPEFFKDINSIDLISGFGAGQCLVQCNDEECYKRACCLMDDELQQVVSKSPKVSPRNSSINGSVKPVSETGKKCCGQTCHGSSVVPTVSDGNKKTSPCLKINSDQNADQTAVVSLTKTDINAVNVNSQEQSVLSQDKTSVEGESPVTNAEKSCCQKSVSCHNDVSAENICSVEINQIDPDEISSERQSTGSDCCQDESDSAQLCSSHNVSIVKEKSTKSDKRPKNDEQVT